MHDWQPNEKLEFYHPTIQQKEKFSNWKSDWGPKGRGNFFVHLCQKMLTLRLKITEKVSFNIASEASYVYILSEWTKVN